MSMNTVTNRSGSPMTATTPRHDTPTRHLESASHGLEHVQRVVTAVSRVPGRIRGDLREDMRSAAMLAYLETQQHHDADRGVPVAGHAYPRMRGTVLDMLTNEERQRGLANQSHDAWTTLNTERVRARLTVERLIDAAGDALDGDERVVLREVYQQGRPLTVVSEEQGWSRSQGVRRNQGLLDRLRRAAGVTVASRSRTRTESPAP